ncbi:site-specific integrase [Bradyrhizobium sp. BR 1433]|uniref:site-specific integrase n=1 Tax=Bradyrhizobium sp. BR 1433 TaxID=3447967 RepID=UPI003EE50237
MNEHLLLAPLLESYFRRRLTKQRNATSATLASYRDALRMLILFAAAHLGKKPAALALEDLDRDLVLTFLDELEEKRNNSVATRNARLAAIRSFFHHVAAADPASFGVAQRVLTIPTKRAHIEVTHHLTNAEVEAIIAALIRRRPAAGATGPFCSSWREPALACPKRPASTRTTFSWSEDARRCGYVACNITAQWRSLCVPVETGGPDQDFGVGSNGPGAGAQTPQGLQVRVAKD